jgi:DNA-binding CsgD family transcriptional regulator
MPESLLATGSDPKIDPKLALFGYGRGGGLMAQTVLLERERELAEITSVLSEAEAGRGGAVAIDAGAGLGKTRLLREARETGSRAGLAVLSGRATELERDFPFALVRQLFETPLARTPAEEREAVLEGAKAARGALGLDPLGDTHDSFAVLHGLYWVTAALAERGPLLLAVDDVHWADAGSLDYLGFLLPRLEELPVALIFTSRPDEPEPPEGLGRIAGDPSVLHLTPTPLSTGAAASLLTQELGRQPEASFAAACHEVSGGNPFLLCELVRTLGEQGVEPEAQEAELVRGQAPERVSQMVLRRIGRLSAEAGAMARSLAVLGDGSDPHLVAKLAGMEPELVRRAGDELRAVSILEPGATLRFVHPLIRNAIYEDVPGGERSMAHAQAAALLRERDAAPEEVATQLLAAEARGDRAAVETLMEVGQRALATGAPRSAIAYLMRALREPTPDDLRAEVLEPLITVSFRAVDHAAWAEIEPEVLAEMERTPSLRSRWAAPLTMAMAMGGKFEAAASMLVEGVEAAVAEGDVHRAFQLEAQLATLAQMVPSVPKVDLTRYADRIDPESPAGRLAAAIEARAAAIGGSAQEAADAAKRALGGDGVIFNEEPELVAFVMLVMTLVAADEVDVARTATERALAVAREREATPQLALGLFLRGFVAWGYGDLTNAVADMRQALDLAKLARIPPMVLLIAGALVEVLIEIDELEEAEAVLGSLGIATGPMPDSAMFSLLLFARAHLQFEQGKSEQSLGDSLALSDIAERSGFGPGPSLLVAPFRARVLVAAGEQAKARELADDGMTAARRWGAPGTVAHAARAVAISRGGAEAIRQLEEAAEMTKDSPRRLGHAEVLVDLGEVLRRQERRAEARPPLREALKIARRCGAARLAKRAGAELEATGERVRRYTPAGTESLTPSERRVAELAASGMTNRQIAQFLFVTVKTVEAHLSAAYDKLDISGRRQLPEALRQAADE